MLLKCLLLLGDLCVLQEPMLNRNPAYGAQSHPTRPNRFLREGTKHPATTPIRVGRTSRPPHAAGVVNEQAMASLCDHVGKCRNWHRREEEVAPCTTVAPFPFWWARTRTTQYR